MKNNMKITKQQLKQIIKEELEKVLKEEDPDYARDRRAKVEKIIKDTAAQSKNHGAIITRVLNTYLKTGKIDPEFHQLDDYGKQLVAGALEDPQLRRGL